MRRVVVTGMGAISGNGDSVRTIWESIVRGEAPRRLTFEHLGVDVNARPFTTKEGPIVSVCGSPLSNDQLGEKLGRKAKDFDRHQLFAFHAAREAMDDAGLHGHAFGDRFGCSCGTGDGGLHETWEATQVLLSGKKLGPRSNLRQLPNLFVGYLTQQYGLRGPSFTHVTACAASSHALMHAADQIMLGRADLMLTGGAEAVITPFGIASFASQGALSNESRPFDVNRKGFLMGEGAAMLILEEEGHARRRGANVYAEITGYAATSDGNPNAHIAEPGAGGIQSANLALAMAGIAPHELGYINTHGTGTPDGDKNEIAGIMAWASDDAVHIPVSSTKSFTGHLLGAAGAIEAALCIKMLQEEKILPTHGLTLENLDPACAGVRHVMQVESLERHHVLSNSFGFGGTNGSIVFSGY